MTHHLAFAILVLATSTPAQARPTYPNTIPNGTVESCDTCHTSGPGSARNAFGLDYAADSDWSVLAGLDSDGDGCTNGEELGDPDGTWTVGSTPPFGFASLPGSAADAACQDPVPDTDPPDTDVPDTDVPDTDTDTDPESGCSTVSVAPGFGVLMLGALLARRGRGPVGR
jgi:hypothetical protein